MTGNLFAATMIHCLALMLCGNVVFAQTGQEVLGDLDFQGVEDVRWCDDAAWIDDAKCLSLELTRIAEICNSQRNKYFGPHVKSYLSPLKQLAYRSLIRFLELKYRFTRTAEEKRELLEKLASYYDSLCEEASWKARSLSHHYFAGLSTLQEWIEAEESRDDAECRRERFKITYIFDDARTIEALLKKHIKHAKTVEAIVTEKRERNPGKNPLEEEPYIVQINTIRTQIAYHTWLFRQAKTSDDKRKSGEELQALHDRNCVLNRNLAAATQESFYAGRCDFPYWNSMEKRKYDAIIAKMNFDVETAAADVLSKESRNDMTTELFAEYQKTITENEERYHTVLQSVRIWKGQSIFAGLAKCLLLESQKDFAIMKLDREPKESTEQKTNEEIKDLLESICDIKLEFAKYRELQSQAGVCLFSEWIKSEAEYFEARRECVLFARYNGSEK